MIVPMLFCCRSQASGYGPPRPRQDRMSEKSGTKTHRACANCQRAHLTCNDARPCERCFKRGLEEECRDGKRKRAKYLIDTDRTTASNGTSTLARSPSQDGLTTLRAQDTLSANVPEALDIALVPSLLAHDFDSPASLGDFASRAASDSNYRYGFGSEIADLEYSMLSDILGNPTGASFDSGPMVSSSLSGALAWMEPLITNNDLILPTNVTSAITSEPSHNLDRANPSVNDRGLAPSLPHSANGERPGKTVDNTNVRRIDLPSELDRPTFNESSESPRHERSPADASSQYPGRPDQQDSSLSSSASRQRRGMRDTTTDPVADDSIYDAVKKPYHYTDGYHALISHLKLRFPKDGILRIVRALAMYRPSLIALQMPLTEEDEIFVEKCFQRTLIEFDKLIALGGTPTVVWRRTCEICLVGKEFTLLTGWKREVLLKRKTYIYELMTTDSAVQYWENFASHAFENTTPSVTKACVLLGPTGVQIPCAFCFTIKRDIFDIPSICIGNFLPILT